METIITRPSATPVMHALRSIGYKVNTAIADLIDNSIDAKATDIDITINAEVLNGSIKIVDNGIGMNEELLQMAMNIGSKDPRNERSENVLGRFGMGLKTASFSLGKRLSVLTKQNGKYHERCWDLDYVSERNEWELFTSLPVEIKQVIGDIPGDSGTIVLIDKLDRFMGSGTDRQIKYSSFLTKVRRIKEHLEFVFHSLMVESKISIFLNSYQLVPWDPYILSNPRTIEGERQILKVNGYRVIVSPYVLPHPSHFNASDYKEAGGIRGWRDQQGFYIYRENRLLYFGDWLGLLPKDTASQLTRIRIDVPNVADEDWQVDVKKSMVSIPEEVKDKLKAISENYRHISKEIFYFRTRTSAAGGKIKGSLNTWEATGNDAGCNFILNRTNPLLVDLMNKIDDSETRRMLNVYLKFVELGSPSNISHTTKPNEEELQEVEDGLKELVLQFSRMIIESELADNQEKLLDVLMVQPAFESFNKRTLKIILEGGDITYE